MNYSFLARKKLMWITVIGLSVACLLVWFWNISKNTPVKLSPTSSDLLVEQISVLPMVQEFTHAVEAKHNGDRHISYRIERTEPNGGAIVVVAETDTTKETVWKRFLVKTDGSILVENSLIGEFEPIE